MRRSTGINVVLKKLAIGQTLYESKMRPKSSWVYVNHCICNSRLMTSWTYISKVLRNQCHGFTFHDTDQDKEHGLIQQRTHGDTLHFVSIRPYL
jgi:hypothetical protein